MYTLISEAATRARCSLKKCVLRNFADFTGKHLCQDLSLRLFFFYRTPLDDCFCDLIFASIPSTGYKNVLIILN